jgi:hypothetical protein
MNKDFTLYPEAFELKELGFDEPCIAYYTVVPEDNINWFTISEQAVTDNGSIFGSSKNYNTEWFETEGTISAPTYAQAFRWFREKYNLRGFIGFRPNVKMFDYHIYDMSLSGLEYTKQRTMEEFNKDPKVGTYEEVELDCLKKLIEIVKEK